MTDCPCSAGTTLCMKLFEVEVTWQRAKLTCDAEHSADLINVRYIEKFSEGNDSLYLGILKDLETLSK